MVPNKKKTSGDKIKSYRTQQGYTQKQLAEKAGIATISIQQYELNTRSPKIETLQKIASALNLPVDAIRSDSDLEHDVFRATLDTWVKSEYKNMAIKQLENVDLDFDDVQLLIAKNSKKLTTEQKQKIIKILLSDD